ncbi:MAG: extracytoplasmic binding receptor [Ramlibacter sp.]|nr:extracytoplasmic binding receptor [Ramlibacter sp.]
MTNRRRFISGMAALSLAPLAGEALAQEYPNKPIRLIGTTQPGGGADVCARLVAERLRELLGVAVLVENQTGATGNIALQSTSRAPADGYTLAFPTAANTANLAARPKQAFDILGELRPVGKVGVAAFTLAVSPALGVSTVEQFIEQARRRKDLAYASIGHGSSQHLVAEMFCDAAKVDMTHVPYRGEAAAMQDLMSGRVHAMFMAGAKPMMDAGKVVGLATTNKTRWPAIPELRPIGEVPSLRGFYYNGWNGVMAPKDTPDAVIQKLSAALGKALQDEKLRAGLRGAGYEAGAGASAEMAEQLQWDVGNFKRIIAERKLTFPE